MILDRVNNPRVKNIVSLQQKSRERRKQNRFVVEGIREIKLALHSHFKLIEIYFCPQILNGSYNLNPFSEQEKIEVTPTVFKKISYRNTGGIIGVFEINDCSWGLLKLSKNPLIIALDKIEKPGNLGAVLRTADAACIDLVLLCDSIIDLYNPNVIRSSLGCLFSVPVINTTASKAVEWLKSERILIHATCLHENTVSLYKADLSVPSAIVMGAESKGLSSTWIENADKLIKIPMQGKIDSLNVSNAAAVCTFEAVRQRQTVDLEL